ncbi:MAG: redoxin domain-containing protein [Planctomycetota bacterium]
MPPTTSLPTRDSVLQPGDTAPDFTLLDQDRNEWTLSEAAAEGPVVLCFYPLAFTGVCGTEMECVTRELERWSEQGARIVGISCDSFASQNAWAEQIGLKHPLLSDMHRAVCKGYGLYWADLNVASRGTVIVERDPTGGLKVSWSEAREPGEAMDFDAVLDAALSS